MSGESKTSADTMFADTDAVKKFWIYLDVFYYQQGSCDELYSAILHTKNGAGGRRNTEEELQYNTTVKPSPSLSSDILSREFWSSISGKEIIGSRTANHLVQSYNSNI